jgi:hypothetical protein
VKTDIGSQGGERIWKEQIYISSKEFLLVHLSLIRQNLSQEGRLHVRFKTITTLLQKFVITKSGQKLCGLATIMRIAKYNIVY